LKNIIKKKLILNPMFFSKPKPKTIHFRYLPQKIFGFHEKTNGFLGGYLIIFKNNLIGKQKY
jgi:hypothetical protein